MRIVLINHSHPSYAHISSARMLNFGRELAAQGCSVVLLTSTFDTKESASSLEDTIVELKKIQSGQMVNIVTPTVDTWTDQWMAKFKNVVIIRKALIAFKFKFYSGIYKGWQKGSEPFLKIIADNFEPELIWATFGNLDTWTLGMKLSKLSQAKLVLDQKDYWDFIPNIFRKSFAKKFNQYADGFTCNAVWQKEHNKKWFPSMDKVIYSGIKKEFLTDKIITPENEKAITLIGSTYDKEKLESFLRSLKKWWNLLPSEDQNKVIFHYAGADKERVIDTFHKVGTPIFRYIIHDFLPIDRMIHLCQSAMVNTYIYDKNGFHHKSVELLACKKLVLAYPNEDQEVIDISKNINNPILIASNETEIINILNQIINTSIENSEIMFPELYSWETQAKIALDYFRDIISA